MDATVETDLPPAGEPVSAFLRRLRTGRDGLAEREAARRLQHLGPNVLPPPPRTTWPRELGEQLIHPLALVLWVAAGLAWVVGTGVIAIAIVAVIVVNALFAFIQERQAQRATAALNALLPHVATVVRDGRTRTVASRELVPGDLVVIDEGDRISADSRIIAGDVEIDMAALTGESMPVMRHAALPTEQAATWMAQTDLVLSGTLCTSGQARAVVYATGGHTELGRIAALSRRGAREQSPLERQIRRVAWLIAAVGIAVGAAFMPLGMLAGLSPHDAFLFAVGLLVANVPEGLLPTITLALAAGVRALAGRGAVVKRLSAVETLGSTTVICTDKTGTLTQGRMAAITVWTPATGIGAPGELRSLELAAAIAECSVVEDGPDGPASPDATETALFDLVPRLGGATSVEDRERRRLAIFRFSSQRRMMSALQQTPKGMTLFAKGAPESITSRCSAVDPAALAAAEAMSNDGLRVLAVATRRCDKAPTSADEAERDLALVGIVGLLDPPRPEVAAAISSCHRAGIQVHVVTGDNGATAAHVARAVGIGESGLRVVTGSDLDTMAEATLDELLRGKEEIVFARSSPEAKLRIADALRDLGHVVAMTGDGVNDAPALHRADIGVAMGLSGTDVARESATMVLTDDDFATIATAVEEGRRVYANVRKFILYIFAHATPEVVPFLVFALAGGLVPLPLTVVQILAIDLGTETLPALALGRERAEPGVMAKPPRPPTEQVVTRRLLTRAWLVLGGVSAVLVCAGFFLTLRTAGWHPGADVGAGTALHHAYLQATTATFLGIVACQLGTAWAARRDTARIRDIGVTSNPLLLVGMAFEVLFSVAIVSLPGLHDALGLAMPPLHTLALIAVFPFVVWTADEMRRRFHRESGPTPLAVRSHESQSLG